jgi:RND family efflux transporter MFP subunit
MTDLSSGTAEVSSQTTRRVWISFAGVALMLAVAGGLVLMRRSADLRALAAETDREAIPTVSVVHPAAGSAAQDLAMPATLQAYVDAPIYARTTGYLQKWYFDIGAHVKEGDVLADLDTPEIDQELAQARAAREETNASLALAKSTAARWADLRKTDSVSQQEADEKQGAYEQLQANLRAADANVRRLENLQAFKHIRAPFSGTVSARTAEVGMLVSAGTAQPLFTMVQVDPLRVYVSVPEAAASSITPGLSAWLELPQFPGERFEGRVVRTSGVIDATTRTLLAEVNVPNRSGRLLPGGYAQVHLAVGAGQVQLQVPINALMFRAEGVRAVVVGADGRAALRPVTIGRDYGTSVEIVQGL